MTVHATVRVTCIVLLALIAALLDSGLSGMEARAERSDDDRTFGRQAQRTHMVRTYLKGLPQTTSADKAVFGAMLQVPRHLFIPKANRQFAYANTPVPIGYGQTISQPYVVALMTQALDLKPGLKVLEVGTGSGYQSAVLARITPGVYSIEIIKPLFDSAKKRLKKLGYGSVVVRHGDGYFGLEESAPFDRIIVTCAAQHVPPPLFAQLKPGGIMVIPVGGVYETQRLLLIRKGLDGKKRSRSLALVRFVPLVRGKQEE